MDVCLPLYIGIAVLLTMVRQSFYGTQSVQQIFQLLRRMTSFVGVSLHITAQLSILIAIKITIINEEAYQQAR